MNLCRYITSFVDLYTFLLLESVLCVLTHVRSVGVCVVLSRNDGHFAFVCSLTVYLIWQTTLAWNISSMACELFYWTFLSHEQT